MDFTRLHDCLAADHDPLRAVVDTGLDAPVPTCPGWTVADLTRHVGEMYAHKTAAVRESVEPEPWPPEEFAEEEPRALLDRNVHGIARRVRRPCPRDPAAAWYGPDQTVGLWIGRTAQETVVHRIDAELAAGQPVAPVPDDLAVDGIDELPKAFVACSVAEWGDCFTGVPAGAPGATFLVRTDAAA
ncbi:maleylpyruvate isomerase N-terminal domain-containing protein [Streptomyces viridiviolaceus]|uniref:Maleylpyruvate isomerase N-terminal domain-containing protein n=1 Tax=Streptomyces viridiviolaceus TaxID=68282 RepID=A0ABW2DYG2_9ACTN|nr:maleylpyruvate isomerase N-terminal domain-containing protein [Streptomyces viridiviolaceus]